MSASAPRGNGGGREKSTPGPIKKPYALLSAFLSLMPLVSGIALLADPLFFLKNSPFLTTLLAISAVIVVFAGIVAYNRVRVSSSFKSWAKPLNWLALALLIALLISIVAGMMTLFEPALNNTNMIIAGILGGGLVLAGVVGLVVGINSFVATATAAAGAGATAAAAAGAGAGAGAGAANGYPAGAGAGPVETKAAEAGRRGRAGVLHFGGNS